VEDRGPGIPPGDRERIWEKFVRLERGDPAHAGGAGIGLSVVRELASLHGATTRVEAADGGGARFVVEFPPGPAAPSLVRIPAEGEA
jgi:signal transduction histidine kinase